MRVIVGEAPSLLGDGRPFTGPSGARLCELLGVPDMAGLRELFELDNIFHHHTPRWDAFDRRHARQIANGKMKGWYQEDEPVTVIMCGRKVWKAFSGTQTDWFEPDERRNVVLWTFPHPSGLNHFWNFPVNVERARRFLRLRADLTPSHSASEQLRSAQGSTEAP